MWKSRQFCAGIYVFLPALILHLLTYLIKISVYTASFSVLSHAVSPPPLHPFCLFVIVMHRNLRLHYCCYLAVTVAIVMARHSGQ